MTTTTTTARFFFKWFDLNRKTFASANLIRRHWAAGRGKPKESKKFCSDCQKSRGTFNAACPCSWSKAKRTCKRWFSADFLQRAPPGGAGKWQDNYIETLRGADVVVIADKDEPGRAHAQLVASVKFRALQRPFASSNCRT